MSVIEKLDGVFAKWKRRSEIEAFAASALNEPDERAWHKGKAAQLDECADELDALMPTIRQALLKADLWDKHAGSFETLEAMLEIASPLVLNKLKAKDATIDARLTNET